MSSLPRLLLRCCQSAIVALALCLVPEVNASFAYSAHSTALELDTLLTQEFVNPSDGASGDTFHSLSHSETQAVEFSQAIQDHSAQPSATPLVSDFLSQPTISSQLLLPPAQESRQLLLAPAPVSAQVLQPRSSQADHALLPAARTLNANTLTPPVTEHRFLPAATAPIGLLPASTPTPSPAVSLAETQGQAAITPSAATITPNATTVPSPSPSVAEQVGRSLAQQASSSAVVAPSNASTPIAAIPQTDRPLLSASRAPQTPNSESLGYSRQRQMAYAVSSPTAIVVADRSAEDSTPMPANSTANSTDPVGGKVSNVNTSNAKALKGNQPNSGSPGAIGPSPSPAAVLAAVPATATSGSQPQSGNTAGTEPTSIASTALGVGGASQETITPWAWVQNSGLAIGGAVGAVLLLLMGVVRWMMTGKTDPETDIDWSHLPRSKSKPAPVSAEPDPMPTKPKRSYADLENFSMPRIVPPANRPHLEETSSVAVLTPKSSDAVAPVAKSSSARTLVQPPSTKPARKAKSSTIVASGKSKSKTNSPSQRRTLSLSPQNQLPQESPWAVFFRSSESGIWLMIAGIGMIGLVAWFLQFYPTLAIAQN